ncbi:MAG: VOC family protein, partial [Caldilineaceae bacterium]|nr:VOC family protein [Caldilineaceae bacterium]
MEFAEIRLILDVADFAASVHFYRDLLGLQPVSSWEKEEGPGIILKAGGGRTIELFGPPPGASHPAQLTTAVKLGLQVEDLDAVY